MARRCLHSYTARSTTFRLAEAVRSTTETTAMVFFILIGASLFSLVFRGYGGDDVTMITLMAHLEILDLSGNQLNAIDLSSNCGCG